MSLLDKILKKDKKGSEPKNELTPYEDACLTYRRLMGENGRRSLHREADNTKGRHGMCSRVIRDLEPRGGR